MHPYVAMTWRKSTRDKEGAIACFPSSRGGGATFRQGRNSRKIFEGGSSNVINIQIYSLFNSI